MKGRPSRAVLAARVAHGLISVFLLACVGVLWAGAIRGRADALTLAALAVLAAEGAFVVAAAGSCPLAPLWRWFGDETPFFELLLRPRAAKAVFPLLTGVCVAGVLVLAVRAL